MPLDSLTDGCLGTIAAFEPKLLLTNRHHFWNIVDHALVIHKIPRCSGVSDLISYATLLRHPMKLRDAPGGVRRHLFNVCVAVLGDARALQYALVQVNEIVVVALKDAPLMLKYVLPDFQTLDNIWIAVRGDWNAFQHALVQTDELVVHTLAHAPMMLKHVYLQFQTDTNIRVALIGNPNAIRVMPEQFRHNYGICYVTTMDAWMRKDAALIRDLHLYIGADLRNDATFMSALVMNVSEFCIRMAMDRALANPGLALITVTKNGSLLCYFKDFYDNKAIVLASVGHSSLINNGFVFLCDRPQFSGPLALADDEDVIIEALTHAPCNYIHLSKQNKQDRLYARMALWKCGGLLSSAPRSIRMDRELVLLAIDNNPNAFEYAWKCLRDDREIAEAAITRNGNLIRYSGFRADPEMATLAVQNNPDAWHYVDAEALGVCPPPKRRRVSRWI